MLPLLYIAFAGFIPYIAASTLFIISVTDAYILHLTSYDTYKLNWLSWALYTFFPVVLVLVLFAKKYTGTGKKRANNFLARFISGRSIPFRLAKVLIILLLALAAALYSYNKNKKYFLLIDHYVRTEQWKKVLDLAQRGLPISNIVQCQVNRALYHSGLLCDKMFSMTQLFGGNGLFMLDNFRGPFALQHSDVFFDLGLINTSEQWAYEAVATNGDTAWNLQRLALVNLLKEKNDIAQKYLNMLKKTLWHRSWAIEHQKYLSDSKALWAIPRYQHLKNTMPESDFLVSPIQPELCLEELLNNTKNKMAFEYFMSYCLLEGQIGRFTKHLHRLKYFNYPKIPRHFEEALLIYNQLTGGKGVTLPEKEISQQTIRRFGDFNKIFARYKKDKTAARRELTKYRDTYWFYGFYYYMPEE
jgi:hypothetical protein